MVKVICFRKHDKLALLYMRHYSNVYACEHGV